MSRTALFVIDIQHALALDPQTAIPHASRVTETSIAILSRARAHIDSARAKGQIPDLEIIVVQHEETPDRGNLQRGSQAWELVFPPRDGDKNERVVGKDVRDTFVSNPRLADELRARDVGTIVAFGIQSECCVLSTSLGALNEGFEVALLSGAHSTYDVDGKAAVLIEREVEDVLKSRGTRIVDWDAWKP